VLTALKPLHEEWSGVELTPSIAYGMRVYQNGSSLTMHTDRIETHVVSSILHIDRDYGGNEPWPIVIEGIDGVTAEVVAEVVVVVVVEVVGGCGVTLLFILFTQSPQPHSSLFTLPNHIPHIPHSYSSFILPSFHHHL